MASQDHKSAAELEREVEMQRHRVSDTIDELQDRLSPGQIVDQLMSYTKGGAGDFAQNMGKSMISNPLPVALLGVSLFWLMTGKSPMDMMGQGGGSGRSSHRSHDGQPNPAYYEEPGYTGGGDSYGSEGYSSSDAGSGGGIGDKVKSVAGGVGEWASGVGEKLSGAASSAGDALGQARGAMRGAGDQFSDARERMGSGLGHAREQLGGGLGQARERLSGMTGGLSHRAHDLRDQAFGIQSEAVDFLKEQPLIAGALAFAAGAALGAVLPVTAKENELMGETADQVKSRIREAAEPLVSQARDVLDDVMEEGKTVLKETMDQGKTALKDTMDLSTSTLKDTVGQAQSKLGESYGHIKETVTDSVNSALKTGEQSEGGAGNENSDDDSADAGATQNPDNGGTTPRTTW